MSSSEFRHYLEDLQRKVIEECHQEVESLAARYYCIDNYTGIQVIVPQDNPILSTPVYISSCFRGENCITVKRIICYPDGVSLGCRHMSECSNWYAIIDGIDIQIVDMIEVLQLVEIMNRLDGLSRYISVKYEY